MCPTLPSKKCFCLLQIDILCRIHGFKGDLQAVGERVSQTEDKMGKYTDYFNTLVDTHAVHDNDLQWLQAKAANQPIWRTGLAVII